jgi:hypothetical protein
MSISLIAGTRNSFGVVDDMMEEYCSSTGNKKILGLMTYFVNKNNGKFEFLTMPGNSES